MAADSGMDTCSSPEVVDSRKRPLDCDAENGSTKRSHYGTGVDGTYHLKVLIPGIAAGAIIGKGGETIAHLQKETGARVKMSKSHDFYPGTTERICLITGNIDAIISVMNFIMEKISEKPDLAKLAVDFDTIKSIADRDKQVKILVPNSTAGMIIGKAGNYIKLIKEKSGSYVQISQKAKDVSLQERCITVIGEKECNRNAIMMILAKIADDPQSGTCLNVSYADVNGPVANYNPTGSPYAQPSSSTSTYPASAAISSVNLFNGSNVGLNVNLSSTITTGSQSVTISQLLDSIKVNLRSTGFTESAIADILSAISILAKYNVLGMGIGVPSNISYIGNALETSSASNGSNNTGTVFGPIGTIPAINSSSPSPRTTLDRFDSFDPFRQSHSSATTPIISNNTFTFSSSNIPVVAKGSSQIDTNSKEIKKDIEIAEIIVGAILGPGGRNLVEIQHLSGANIQISKKGMFAPGTQNRIVTITGFPDAIKTAQYLIEHRITEEESKRARHNTIANMIH